MSNLLRTLRREAGVWKRREGADAAKVSRATKARRKRQARRAARARRDVPGVGPQRPLPLPSVNPMAPPPPPTLLGRLRAVFAPRSSSKGR